MAAAAAAATATAPAEATASQGGVLAATPSRQQQLAMALTVGGAASEVREEEEERGDLAAPPMHGSRLRVAYQGVPGAYSEAAACKAYPGCEPIPCDQFDVAFQSVELWLADRAVLPVENSLGGSIHRNYDLLLDHRLHIVGEVQLAVRHCLLALPGVEISEIRRVISHPQALAQCEGTLSRLLPSDASREAVDDTAGAAQFIAAHSLRDTAAVASARAAQIYGLRILAQGIQDDAANVTRFVMLARDPVFVNAISTAGSPSAPPLPPYPPRPFKTSIAFRDSTATLFKVLAAFAFRGINLTKIESRPSHRSHSHADSNGTTTHAAASANGTSSRFDYLFYIDFEASLALPAAQNALAELQEFVSFVRVLGSYPMDTTSPLL